MHTVYSLTILLLNWFAAIHFIIASLSLFLLFPRLEQDYICLLETSITFDFKIWFGAMICRSCKIELGDSIE